MDIRAIFFTVAIRILINRIFFLNTRALIKRLTRPNFLHRLKSLNPPARRSWGYPDQAVFRLAAQELQGATSPRVDVYLTLSTHEPFDVPDKNFEKVFDEKLKQVNLPESKRRMVLDNRNIFSCLLYTDDAIRSLMHYYASREDYGNTIFFITGDHRLVPIPPGNKIDRFHVPLIIYSPMLRHPKTFSAMAIHSEITPSVLGLLKAQFDFQFPSKMPFISGPLSVDTTFTSDLDIAMIQNKNGTDQYMEGEYFLSNDQLFRVLPGLGLKPVKDQYITNHLKQKLQDFKARTIYACENNRLDKISQKKGLNILRPAALSEALPLRWAWSHLTPNQRYEKARQLAFSQNYSYQSRYPEAIA